MNQLIVLLCRGVPWGAGGGGGERGEVALVGPECDVRYSDHLKKLAIVAIDVDERLWIVRFR